MHEIFGEPIYAYTRAQAIEDGSLVDVSTAAREAGIKYPVAMTSAVWERCVRVPRGLAGVQDEAGRLWDVVYLLSVAIRVTRQGSRVAYCVRVQTSARQAELIRLYAVCGPGDDAAPVVTIMAEGED